MPPADAGAVGRYEEYSKKEIAFVEAELKDWFLQRRFAMERNMAVKKDSLSTNAKQMKSEMYTKMFKDSTDLDHPCRISGSQYLQCIQSNFKDLGKNRQMKCMSLSSSFDACRKGVLQQQAKALENALIKQDIADRRAKALFERRATLLDAQVPKVG